MAKARVRLISNFADVEKKVVRALPKLVRRACFEVRNEWVESLSGARSGRLYRLPGSSARRLTGKRYRAARRRGGMVAGYYRASAPGEAPARRFGDLIRSIRVRPRTTPQRIYARVGTDFEHAVYLEYGTESMDARPSLRPALRRAGPAIRRILGERLI